VASKAAGLAFLFQLLFRIMGTNDSWIPLVAWGSFLTMTVGNLVAIVQTNIKRFMAFSAISQAGYLLMGFLGNGETGVPAVLFYMLVYLLSNLLVFAVIIFYGNETGREQIDEYRGLARLHPAIAAAMMLGLFSLAGIPPLAGFTGKFFLFSVAAATTMS
jgi:NADH-quinone oxidoreductase subunit N